MKAALVVLDVQNAVFGDDNTNLDACEQALTIINSAIALFREHHLPIVFVQHTSSHLAAGTHPWELYRGLDFHPTDPRICKTQMNAFWQTELDAQFKALGVDAVIVTGFFAEYCVLTTTRGAIERGYTSRILRGGIGTIDNARTQFVYDISDVISFDELKAHLPELPIA